MKKEKNHKKLKEMMDELRDDKDKSFPVQESKKSEKDKKKDAGRGIETMFRTSLRNHMELSAIADNKANIMLSINAIIISIVLSALLPRLYQGPELVIPTVILLSVCVLTLIFATISTIPKVTSGTFTKEDIEKKRANLLFFGNFHNMSLEDFEWGIDEMMKDKDFLYGSMARDFFNLGKVLSRKYYYLRICYLVFMFGLVISVAAFIVAFILK